MVIEYRETDAHKRHELSSRISRLVRENHGIDCTIDLVSAHTLPRTSSGKLSRAGTQRDYLKRQQEQAHQNVRSLHKAQTPPQNTADTPGICLAKSGSSR
jgi:fatty-acyl-CoA synthase